MKRLFFLALFSLIGGAIFQGGGVGTIVSAQSTHPILESSRIPPRVEDHFWRRKIVHRIDLGEKVNFPLIDAEDLTIYGPTHYDHGERKGIIAALFNGLKSGKFLAYHPDSLQKSLTYDDITAWAGRITGSGASVDEWDEEESEFDEFDAGDEFESDEFEDDMDDMDDMDDDLDEEGDTDPNDPFGGGGATGGSEFEIAPFETVLELIEDRIFDKNRSDMVYDIQYIRLVYVDPAETLPDQNFAVFKYTDVLETLEDTQWKNKYNDAEYRNLREIFELRLFNSVITNVSGRGVKTLEEADFRRDQLVEFEHNLWSY